MKRQIALADVAEAATMVHMRVQHISASLSHSSFESMIMQCVSIQMEGVKGVELRLCHPGESAAIKITQNAEAWVWC